MNPILELLAHQLSENLGNRITPALANGICLAIDHAMKPPAPPADQPVEQPKEQ